jgi:hypothetical protein
MGGTQHASGALKVKVVDTMQPDWTNNQPAATADLTPDCSISVTAGEGMQLDTALAGYSYSVDGGTTWISRQDNWPNRYECDALPLNAGWILTEGKTGYESVANGILRLNDTGTNWGDKVRYGRNWNANPNVGVTVLARMRCLSGGHPFDGNIWICDSVHSESLYLMGTGMLSVDYYCKFIPETTNEWHTYRFTVKVSDFNIYVDENPEPAIRGPGGMLRADSTNRLMIGSGASQYTQDIYYDYVYWTTEGAFPPTNLWPAVYSGNGQSGTITALDVPFNQSSSTLNKIRFSIGDTGGHIWQSPVYNVSTSGPVTTAFGWPESGSTTKMSPLAE